MGVATYAGYNTCALQGAGHLNCWGLNYGHLPSFRPNSADGDLAVADTYQRAILCNTSTCEFDPIKLSLSGTGATRTIAVGGLSTGQTLSLHATSDCSDAAVGSASDTTPSISLSSLAEGEYRYFFTTTLGTTTSSCSQSYLSVVVDTTAPSGLTATTALNGSNHEVSIGQGLLTGDVLKVYSDSTCATSVGSALSVGSSLTLDLETA